MVFDPDKEEIIQLIGFYVGQRFFGADILTVREILRDPVIDKVDDTPEFAEGIVRLRGEVIPVVDLKRRLAVPKPLDGKNRDWVLITQVDRRMIGFIVDDVTRIIKAEADSIMPAPELVLAELRSQYIRGVCNSEMGLLVVVDLDRMLMEEDVQALRQMSVQ